MSCGVGVLLFIASLYLAAVAKKVMASTGWRHRQQPRKWGKESVGLCFVGLTAPQHGFGISDGRFRDSYRD